MYDENLKRYDSIADLCPRFDRKGKTMPYTSANGYMFSLLNKAGELGFRFSKEDQEAFVKKYNTTFFKSYGATMKGYVLIPEKMFDNKKNLAKLLNKSYDYVMSLEPK
ncbi:MAG: hypothetical protein HKO66_03790 [Saprospiraceae bacterium]|nr:hypothetical protein [Bacteroidia bacterium]NNE15026.1 hypothetical protein [Saprospiraceae bacterium]NNL91334.1 hypothetical protein [Saprospiraceae bacterium]